MIEFGIILEPSPGYTATLAAEVEALGFDILLCPDTQNLSPDPIGQLNLALASAGEAAGIPCPRLRELGEAVLKQQEQARVH